MPELLEQVDRIEIRSPLRGGLRVVFALLALFPLLAPYELLVRIDWHSYLHPFFLFAALISAGALALSGLLLFAAVAGLSSRMVFDAARSSFTYSATAPLIRERVSVHPMSAIARVDVGTREWSDSAPSYYLRIVTTDGTVYETGSSWSRDEIEGIRGRVDAFLRRAADAWSPS